jgi:hypothetical protein
MRALRVLAFGAVLAAASACGDLGQASTVTFDGADSIDIEELSYTCGSFPFDPAVINAGPGDAELGPEPLAVALRSALSAPDHGGFLPQSGWYLAGEDGQRAEFVAVGGANGMFVVSLEASPDGWRSTGWGDCMAQVRLADGLHPAVWSLDPGAPLPDASTQVFDALVTERACAGGRSADGRVVEPWVAADPEQVVVVFAVVASEGMPTCPSNPASRVTVDLGEPLGERILLDGGRFPAGDPAEPDF